MKTRTRFVMLLSLCGCLVVALAQSPTAPGSANSDPTFQAGAREVLVDTVVADKKGNVPRDLTEKNFKIHEDNKEQKITTFSRESMGGAGHSKHFVVLYFESDAPRFREAAMQFVDEHSNPNLYIAVYARQNLEIHLQQGFTADAARIKAALADMRVIEHPTKPLRNSMDDDPPIHLSALNALAETLAPIHGRKALIDFGWNAIHVRSEAGGAHRTANGGWAKPRWPPPTPAHLDETVEYSNWANVSVYSFDFVGGSLRSRNDYAYRPARPEDDRGAVLNVMDDLASRTGGRYDSGGMDNLASYLASVAAEQDDYYLLGYVPPESPADRPCHKLKVTVDRKGLDVNARESYCTSGATDAQGAKPQKALEARMTGGPGTVKIGLQLPWFYSKTNQPLVEVAMDIDPSAMKIRGRLRGEIDVAGIVSRADGSIVTRIGDVLNLEFETQAQMDEFLKVPFHYSKEFTVPPGRYDVRIAAGSADQAFGTVAKSLEIEPWGGQTLALSALALSDDDRPLPGLTAGIDNEMLEGPHRLGSNGRETVPMGGAEFHTNGLAFFYFEVYEPDKTQTPTMRIRILNRETGEEIENSGIMSTGDWVRPGNPVIPIALTLPTAKLPVGEYTLEVRVNREDSQDSVVRTASFDVR